ncbi:Peptidase family M23 [Microbacterium azadirachtae]|uniref:Peptidase family M23 n=1 Tax=Microbacterium azadirachtae TaxID=582680 RepID=A0A1I6G4B5_9MICO|nr:Peptidase family M23 [Microbacterium azadirachtae]
MYGTLRNHPYYYGVVTPSVPPEGGESHTPPLPEEHIISSRAPETELPSARSAGSPSATPGTAAPRSRRELREQAAAQASAASTSPAVSAPAAAPAEPASPAAAPAAETRSTPASEVRGTFSGSRVADPTAPQTRIPAPPQASEPAARSAAPAQFPPHAVPAGRRPRRNVKRLSRSTGAALAISALVVGTALPAIGMVRASDAQAANNASADIRAQSFTAANGVLPDVQVHGTFTATTPTELSAKQAATAAAARTGVASIAQPGQVIYPMAAGSYTLTDGFGAPRSGRSHMGQDFAAPIGTPIYAAADGCVTLSQESYQGYGVSVELSHAALSGQNAVSTLYAHMDYGTRAVQVGECVTAGQFLGRVGNTGWTVGSCLHFEVHINDSAIDPLAWLQSNVF